MRSRPDRAADAVAGSEFFSVANAPDQCRRAQAPAHRRKGLCPAPITRATPILAFPVMTAPQVSMASFLRRGTRCSSR
jgi:hypothetical protein